MFDRLNVLSNTQGEKKSTRKKYKYNQNYDIIGEEK